MNAVKCDVCGDEYQSEELFWREAGIDNDKQHKVCAIMTTKDQNTCCDECFYELLKGEK